MDLGHAASYRRRNIIKLKKNIKLTGFQATKEAVHIDGVIQSLGL
jgi:hypothetical protein